MKLDTKNTDTDYASNNSKVIYEVINSSEHDITIQVAKIQSDFSLAIAYNNVLSPAFYPILNEDNRKELIIQANTSYKIHLTAKQAIDSNTERVFHLIMLSTKYFKNGIWNLLPVYCDLYSTSNQEYTIILTNDDINNALTTKQFINYIMLCPDAEISQNFMSRILCIVQNFSLSSQNKILQTRQNLLTDLQNYLKDTLYFQSITLKSLYTVMMCYSKNFLTYFLDIHNNRAKKYFLYELNTNNNTITYKQTLLFYITNSQDINTTFTLETNSTNKKYQIELQDTKEENYIFYDNGKIFSDAPGLNIDLDVGYIFDMALMKNITQKVNFNPEGTVLIQNNKNTSLNILSIFQGKYNGMEVIAIPADNWNVNPHDLISKYSILNLKANATKSVSDVLNYIKSVTLRTKTLFLTSHFIHISYLIKKGFAIKDNALKLLQNQSLFVTKTYIPVNTNVLNRIFDFVSIFKTLQINTINQALLSLLPDYSSFLYIPNQDLSSLIHEFIDLESDVFNQAKTHSSLISSNIIPISKSVTTITDAFFEILQKIKPIVLKMNRLSEDATINSPNLPERVQDFFNTNLLLESEKANMNLLVSEMSTQKASLQSTIQNFNSMDSIEILLHNLSEVYRHLSSIIDVKVSIFSKIFISYEKVLTKKY